MPTTPVNRINNLQALRAFAAINVVVFHAIGTAAGYAMPVYYLKPLEGWGSNGVDIFFVISGFMMAQIGIHKRPTPLHFLIDRIKRICPTYYFWTAIMLIVSFSIPQVMNNQHVDIKQYVTSFLFLSQLLTGKFPAIYVGWSLEYEMLFYVIFACCLLANNIKVALALCLITLIFLVVLNLSKPLVLEFGFGMGVGIIIAKLHPTKIGKLAWPCFWLGFLGLLATIFYRPVGEQSYLMLLVLGVPATFLVFSLSIVQQIKNKFLILIGDASYSIYLVQVLTLPASFKIFVKMNVLSGDVAVVLAVLATTAFGIISYFCIELSAKLLLPPRSNQTTMIAKA
jgi:exopolysaccharide production protein ExoZ